MTNTPEPPSTLDRIERILEQTATRLDRVAEQQQANTTAIAQLTQQQEQNTTAIAELRSELEDSISDLVGVIGNFVEEGQSERQSLRERLERLASEAAQDRQQATADRQAWQAEIRRIWEYLLGQSGNGRNP